MIKTLDDFRATRRFLLATYEEVLLGGDADSMPILVRSGLNAMSKFARMPVSRVLNGMQSEILRRRDQLALIVKYGDTNVAVLVPKDYTVVQCENALIAKFGARPSDVAMADAHDLIAPVLFAAEELA